MGRKPNQLILHYFHRGQKLDDASNRYQHTCKACGEVFPKGRIDSLQNHLIRKCPALTAQDQSHILSEIYQLSPARKDARAKQKQSQVAHQNRPPQQTFDGLNVLAEASRQVTQVERRDSQSYPSTTAAQDDNDPINMAIDPALDVFPHSFPNTFDHELGSFAQTNGSDIDALVLLLADNTQASHAPDMTSNTIPPLPHLSTEHPEDVSHSHAISTHDSINPENHTQQDHDLSSIAAGASELLPAQGNQMDNIDHGTADASGGLREHGDHGADSFGQNTIAEMNGQNMDVSAAVYEQHALPEAHPTHETPSTVDQANGGRNETAQESEKNGESWVNIDDGPNFQAFWEVLQRTDPKSPKAVLSQAANQRPIAIRSQVGAGEFGEFSIDSQPPQKFTRQKFSAERRKEVRDVRKKGACLRCRMLRKPCSAETPCDTCRNIESARLWKEPCMRVRITELFGLYGMGLHVQLAHRQVQVIRSDAQRTESRGSIHFTHFDDLAPSVSITAIDLRVDSSHIPELASISDGDLPVQSIKLLEGEGEDVVNLIAHYLQSQGPLLRDNEASRIVKLSLTTLGDMFQENQEPLLEDVLQLWTATRILCDPQLSWKFSYVSSNTQQSTHIDETTDRPSYRLLACQLQAFVERRASQICKKVLQNYEKKLMHNKRTFDMFLVAVVVINCFERMEWLFHIWDTPDFFREWPLDRKPNEFFDQGERFADIIHMVLKMRLIPPRIAPRPDSGILMPVDAAAPDHVVSWYANAELTVNYLNSCSNASFSARDSRSFDLRYASKILLPQNAYS